MSDRERKDFVRVRARAGDVCIVAGDYALKLAAGETKEITRAEWNELFKDRGVLEIAEEKKGTETSRQGAAKGEN